MASFYAMSLALSLITLVYETMTGEKEAESNTMKYKVYWYFNNFRYAAFMVLCGIIGIVYIKSYEYELKLNLD